MSSSLLHSVSSPPPPPPLFHLFFFSNNSYWVLWDKRTHSHLRRAECVSLDNECETRLYFSEALSHTTHTVFGTTVSVPHVDANEQMGSICALALVWIQVFIGVRMQNIRGSINLNVSLWQCSCCLFSLNWDSVSPDHFFLFSSV